MAGQESHFADRDLEKNTTPPHADNAWLGESLYGLPKDARPEGSNACLQAGVGTKLHLGWCEPEPIHRLPIPNDRQTISAPVLFQFRF